MFACFYKNRDDRGTSQLDVTIVNVYKVLMIERVEVSGQTDFIVNVSIGHPPIYKYAT